MYLFILLHYFSRFSWYFFACFVIICFHPPRFILPALSDTSFLETQPLAPPTVVPGV